MVESSHVQSHENESDKENMPPPALKSQFTGKSFFSASRTVTVQANPDLLKGLIFYLEVFTNGEAADNFFKKAIAEHGGKISRRLGKHVTHLVWSDGRTKTLTRALDYEQIKIVSTLWFKDTLENQKLANEEQYRPSALD